jgi:glycine/D-amino acid oxidase-like deaminating enzyme
MPRRLSNWGAPPWKGRFHPKSRSLPESADFAVVGGGFSGLSAAAFLARMAPSKSVAVLESGVLGSGSSGHTGGMALDETAAGPLPGLGDVLAGYRAILRVLRIDAEQHLPGAYELGRSGMRAESAIAWSDSGTLGVVRTVPGGTVNPAKVVAGLARAAQAAGAKIFEYAEVRDVDFSSPVQLRIRTAKGVKRLRARRVLFATNAFSLNLPDMRETSDPRLTLAVATEPLTAKQISALGLRSRRPFYTVDYPYLWGRLMKNNAAIFGSGLVSAPSRGGLAAIDIRKGDAAERMASLEARVHLLHPVMKNVRVTHRWGGPILLTPSALPVFRRHPQSRDAVVLGGFNGHGVALSVYLGKWAAEALLDKRELPSWPIESKKTVVR